MDVAADGKNRSVWNASAHCVALDGVRGLAILLVTLYRFGYALEPAAHPLIAIAHRVIPTGQFGVDLFFVLSGFLITGILLRTKDEPHYYRNFIYKRALRIFPLYFATLVLGLLVVPAFFSQTLFDQAVQEQAYLWTYTTNLRMSWLNQWCFGPFDHFWSLAVEEHFYLVWPLAVCSLRREQLWKLCMVLVVLVFAVRTIAATHESMTVAVETLTIFRLDALCMGAMTLIAIVSERPREQLIRYGRAIMLVLIPMLMLLLAIGHKFLALPYTICPAFFAAGMLVLLLSPKASLQVKAFENRGLVMLGKYSYGMYVFQLPLVALLPLTRVAGYLPANPLLQAASYVALMFGLTLLMAFASYHLFELHFLKLKRRFERVESLKSSVSQISC